MAEMLDSMILIGLPIISDYQRKPEYVLGCQKGTESTNNCLKNTGSSVFLSSTNCLYARGNLWMSDGRLVRVLILKTV